MLGIEIRGVRVDTVSVERHISFRRELYAGITWDSAAKLPVAILSGTGGVDVESSAPALRRTFDPWRGLSVYEGRELASEAGLTG
ncbi:MAG: succinate--CoA ligase subunit beta, partial [Alphaproteobacteria bacterium]|nr:succinate--CoA ligase subunit beta [Alphaproteobacteria bacterium]